MKKIIAIMAFAFLSILFPAVANADGAPGCSNPCEIDEDATHGETDTGTEVTSGPNTVTYREHGDLDEDGWVQQYLNMEPNLNDSGSWSSPDHVGTFVGPNSG